jgi:hypothetical protein
MKTAVVWIAGGESYTIDAITSRDSLKRWNPDIPCILATDVKNIPTGYDGLIELSPRRYPAIWYLDSTRYVGEAFNALRNDFDSILFLDTDTYIAAPIDDLFELADRFDICVSHGVTRQTTNTINPIPNSFPEFEIGVMLVQTNERVKNLFADWLELYEKHSEVYKNNDQGPLREALWINKYINMYVLTEEYHCRWGFGSCVVSTVRILHSRSCGENPHTNAMAALEVNAVGGRRLFNSEGIQGKPVASGRY